MSTGEEKKITRSNTATKKKFIFQIHYKSTTKSSKCQCKVTKEIAKKTKKKENSSAIILVQNHFSIVTRFVFFVSGFLHTQKKEQQQKKTSKSAAAAVIRQSFIHFSFCLKWQSINK